MQDQYFVYKPNRMQIEKKKQILENINSFFFYPYYKQTQQKLCIFCVMKSEQIIMGSVFLPFTNKYKLFFSLCIHLVIL